MPYHHLSKSKSCFDSWWLPTHHLGTLSNALNYQSSWGFDGGQKHLSERWRSRQTGSGYILTSFLKLEWIYYESGNLKINLYIKNWNSLAFRASKSSLSSDICKCLFYDQWIANFHFLSRFFFSNQMKLKIVSYFKASNIILLIIRVAFLNFISSFV